MEFILFHFTFLNEKLNKYLHFYSFSTVEGLALAIEQSNFGIWMNFGATALHKFVIAFSVGVELLSSKVFFNIFAEKSLKYAQSIITKIMIFFVTDLKA